MNDEQHNEEDRLRMTLAEEPTHAPYGMGTAMEHKFSPKSGPRFNRCQTCGLRYDQCQAAQKLAWGTRMPDEQTIEERARFLAHEIHGDKFAKEPELAEAIAREIRRFLK